MIQVATPSRIYERPNSVYVADFIGDVNIINGQPSLQARQISIVWDAEHAPIIAPSDASFGTDDTMCILPSARKSGDFSGKARQASENSYPR